MQYNVVNFMIFEHQGNLFGIVHVKDDAGEDRYYMGIGDIQDIARNGIKVYPEEILDFFGGQPK